MIKKKGRKVLSRPRQIVAKEVYAAITDIFEKGVYMDKAIEKMMKKNKVWGVRDRAFAATTTYDMVRNWRLLLSAANIEFDYTIIQFWKLFGTLTLLKGEDLGEYKSLNELPVDSISERLKKFKNVRKIRESYPDWIDNICAKELGKDWDAIATALNKPSNMVIRANTLKTSREKLKDLLEHEGIETTEQELSPDALQLVFSRNVFRSDAFTNGLFEVQDAASQLVSDFLEAKSGMRIIDACAGSGGKTLHLAAIMKNKGKIIALDYKEFKLEELRKRASRAGANIIEAKVVENTKVVKRLYETADRVLLDMPCSGLGVLRRNPDSKWILQANELERVKEQQQQLLQQYAQMTKIGGKVVYAVCSILPSEGEEQVALFLKNNPNFELEGEKRYSPAQYECDGFYMAKMIRKELPKAE
jgi:16S rRNA (cytosine967-C5)-methyltransferase